MGITKATTLSLVTGAAIALLGNNAIAARTISKTYTGERPHNEAAERYHRPTQARSGRTYTRSRVNSRSRFRSRRSHRNRRRI